MQLTSFLVASLAGVVVAVSFKMFYFHSATLGMEHGSSRTMNRCASNWGLSMRAVETDGCKVEREGRGTDEHLARTVFLFHTRPWLTFI